MNDATTSHPPHRWIIVLGWTLPAIVAYVVALYLGGIVVGARIGGALFGHTRARSPLPLFVGLLLVSVATELPLLGGWIALAVILLGLGTMYRAARAARVEATA